MNGLTIHTGDCHPTGEAAAEAYILAAHRMPLSESQIAALHGVSRSRIWQLLQRAMKKLRKVTVDDED